MLTLVCAHCNQSFVRHTGHAKQGPPTRRRFCDRRCKDSFANTTVTRPCGQCGTSVTRMRKEARGSKSGHLFCDNSCAALYSNAHKTVGTRRSKLEVWLEAQLRTLYPNLTLLPNDKTAINSELDFYFPELNLAFELNGIFHYEPIYGPEKLASIQNNDHRKFAACIEKSIALCIIDSSRMVNFKESKAKVFLDIICDILDKNSPISPPNRI